MSARIVFTARTPNDTPDSLVLADDERVEFDGPWLHVVKVRESIGEAHAEPLHTYASHAVTAVHHRG
jgi:hypothetical protein